MRIRRLFAKSQFPIFRSSMNSVALLTIVMDTRILNFKAAFICFISFVSRRRRIDERLPGTGNSFLLHMYDSVVPVENRSSALFFYPPNHPSSPSDYLAINRYHCHLLRRINIFNIRPNLTNDTRRIPVTSTNNALIT